ncbi:equilibrative nucleoside transporter 4-like [Gigantopelta aegis]|uniref:equilibrative nucleoside transporter 4-like n=1 Tax=Gigantopelta aegis TaxID=1735272 RepID=UPI001B88DC0D|nr:equilibrative nucleoside transporter 4-like [Gigantopelta aegis]
MEENSSQQGYCQLRSPKLKRRKSIPRDRLTPPRDPCSCIYLALVLAGAGFLLPYNSFIIAVDFYQSRFPASTIIFDMSLMYIVVAFFSVCVNNAVVELLSMPVRITFGYIVSFVTLLLIALCDVWFQLFSEDVAYRITLLAVAVVAVGSTVQQSSFYGYTSMLPRRYTQAVMTGESAAGLIISINRIVTKALLDDQRINTMIFFCISISIIWMCFVLFHVTRRTDFVRFYVSMCESAKIAEDQRGLSKPTVTEEVSLVDFHEPTTGHHYGVLVIQSPTSPVEAAPAIGANQSDVTPNDITRSQEAEVSFQGQYYKLQMPKISAFKRGLLMRYEVSKTVWPFMLAIGLAYFVTLCLFPGIESEVISCKIGSWMPIVLMAVFNLFDFIGKIIASLHYDWPRGRLVVLTLSRIIFVPLLMICATPRIRPILMGDGWPIVLSLLLGITNGYFGSVPMILAPTKVSEEQKELCGNIMMLSYSIGLTSGSVVAYLLDEWLGPHPAIDPCFLNTTMVATGNSSYYHNVT